MFKGADELSEANDNSFQEYPGDKLNEEGASPFDIDADNYTRNKYKINSKLLELGPILDTLSKTHSKSKWLKLLNQLHQNCLKSSNLKDMMTNEQKELIRLRNECYIAVAKTIKAQKAIERSRTSHHSYINPSVM